MSRSQLRIGQQVEINSPGQWAHGHTFIVDKIGREFVIVRSGMVTMRFRPVSLKISERSE